MKTITFVFVLATITMNSAFSQNWQQNLSKRNPGDKPLTLPEYQKAFNDYWDKFNVQDGYYYENGKKEKAPGWKIFKRWEYYWEQRVDLATGEFPKTTSVDEYEKYLKTRNNIKKTNYSESWTNLGTNSSSGGYAGIGRINCIAFHPTDVNIFWVGSPSGGIWKTADGGGSWVILNDNESVLGVSAIVIDYTNPNIIYIATGDRDGGSMSSLGGGQVADNASIGVLKSIDGGATWNTTALSFPTSQKKKVYDLIMHPTNHLILLASISSGTISNSGGIYKTADGGDTWNKTTYSYPCWRIAFKPGDPTTVYGVETYYGSGYVQYFDKSINTGDSWDGGHDFGSGTDALRTELAVTSANPSVVYLLTCDLNSGLNGVYKSDNSGVSFSRVDDGTKSLLGYESDGSGPNEGQGDYDLCIAVSPSDANEVYIGGVNSWKSINGGVDWTCVNHWSTSPPEVVHADKHVLAYQSSTVLFEGNDGGIYKTTNGGTNWIDLTDGMVTSQIYRIGVSQTSVTTVLTGMQDNGTKKYSSSWSDVKGGDGMECIVDYSDANYMYATYVRGQITRSVNGFTDWHTEVDISANIPGGQPTGAWVTPYVIDPNNSSTLFAGYDQVWKTIDRGNDWTSASQVLSSSNKLRSLAIAPSNSNVLYAADQTHMWKTTTGSGTWSSITLPSLSNSITYIAVKNDDPSTVWFTVGGYTSGQKVYQSVDGGSNWTEIGTGLPNLPIMSIVQYKKATDRNVLFVGTDLGVYVKDGTNDWASYSTGLPSVVVTELEIYYASSGADILRAGTFGRGLWETEIDAALPVELSSFTGRVIGDKINLKWVTATEVNNYGFDVERKSNVKGQTSNDWMKIGFVKGNGNSNSPKQYSFTDDNPAGSNKFSYRLKQIDNDGQYKYSEKIEIDLVPNVYALYQNYPNPFNPSTTISYALPESGNITLKIFNSLGEEVATLVNGYTEAGVHTVSFSAKHLPSGIYIYQLCSNGNSLSKKMLLMK